MKKLEDSYENPLVTRSKQMLTDAFFELLKEKPSKKIRISKLCEKAGVARPTFYTHYNTIEEIPLAYFGQWLNDMEEWVDQQAQEEPHPMLDPKNQFSPEFGNLVFRYWCSEVELVKRLQNAGYENVILQTFIKAHELIMKELVAPVHGLSIYFQNFLQSKAAIVTFELYKYWIATEMQLSIEQLVEINSNLNTRQELVEITRIGMGLEKE